jgi:hypothetical protein
MPALLVDYQEIAQQTLVENNLLKSLLAGLRSALAWEVYGDDCSRKRSTLLFIAKSFQRHLERLMTLEEVDGYMDIVLQTKPFLGKAVDAMKEDHDRFRKGTGTIVERLNVASPLDLCSLDDIGADLAELLNRLERHGKKEAKLFQEAFEQEEGGEG